MALIAAWSRLLAPSVARTVETSCLTVRDADEELAGDIGAHPPGAPHDGSRFAVIEPSRPTRLP